jgi:Tfp pilus assembly ATPase PilU
MIRDEKIHMIHNAMQAGQERSGMCTMNQALLDLYQEGKISLDDTIARCSDPEEMRAMMANAGIDPTGGASMATAVDQPKIRDPKGRKKK